MDNGFPVIKIVNVSSFSEAIKLPNQDFFVISGEDSGVGLYTVSMSTIHEKKEKILKNSWAEWSLTKVLYDFIWF